MNKIHVISAGRNAGKFVTYCIDSVKRQTLQPDSHIVVDDISDDNTAEELKAYEDRKDIPYLKIIHNTERQYRLKNIYDHSIDKDPEDIICVVDSDDWLAKKDALATVKEAYESDPKLEYVYTNYRRSHEMKRGHGEMPSDDWDPYKGGWPMSHMSTFKVKTLARIPKANFLDWNGQWFRMATDFAYILPVMHTLRERDGDYSAVKFIDEVFYVYHFFNNPGKPRSGPEGDRLGSEAVRNSDFIQKRGYIEEAD